MEITNPKIALAQIEYHSSAKKNVEKIKKYISLAKKNNAEIICFPESCIHKSQVLRKDHWFIKEIQEQCKKNSVWSIITEDLKINDKKYNCSILIDRSGRIKGEYRKINLCGDDVIPGRKVKVFETDFAKIGIAICWDLNFPSLFSEMRDLGAEIVFCPALWNYDIGFHEKNVETRERSILKSLVSARAYENLYYVALCNPAKKGKHTISYSAIASPNKILKSKFKREGLLVSKVNLKKLKKLKKSRDS